MNGHYFDTIEKRMTTILGDLTKNLIYTTWTYKIAELNQIDNSIKQPKLYIPSTLNIDLILWHTQLIVCAENSNQGLNHGVFLSPFKLTPCPIH